MKKVILVIGQSASGKSTFVIKKFMKDSAILIEKPFKHTIVGMTCLLGDYLADKRCVGTDTLSMSIINDLIKFVQDNKDNFDILIAEGDRINNSKFFNFISTLNIPVTLHVFSCSLKESMERRKQTGSNSSETFVKTTITKSNNMKTIGTKLGFKIIETNTGEKYGFDKFLG